MSQNESQNQTNEAEPKKSRFLLKTVAYSIAGVSAAAIAAPFLLAGYAYWRTTELTGKATKWAFDNPIKTIAGAAAGAGMYYAANNIDWQGIEEKVSENGSHVIQEYHQTKLANLENHYSQKTQKLEDTITTLDSYTRQVEQQNNLLREGGSVIYEQYDPKLLLGIGAGSAVIGGLICGLAGYATRKQEKVTTSTPRKTTPRLRQL